MIIYLDESKRLGQGLIVVGWFISSHNTSYIEKFVENKKSDFWIPQNIELKSVDKYWKIFIERLANDMDFKILDMYTFGFMFDNYFFDSEEAYTNIILKILKNIFDIKIYNWEKVKIIHDNLNTKGSKLITKKVESFSKEVYDMKVKFEIHNSKKFLSLQLADLIVSKYKELYFFDSVTSLDKFIEIKDIFTKKT